SRQPDLGQQSQEPESDADPLFLVREVYREKRAADQRQPDKERCAPETVGLLHGLSLGDAISFGPKRAEHESPPPRSVTGVSVAPEASSKTAYESNYRHHQKMRGVGCALDRPEGMNQPCSCT